MNENIHAGPQPLPTPTTPPPVESCTLALAPAEQGCATQNEETAEPPKSDVLSPSPTGVGNPEMEILDESSDWEEVESLGLPGDDETLAGETSGPVTRVRRQKRQAKPDAAELRLQGRRALCKSLTDIAPHMPKMVKLRILGRYLQSTRGMEEDDLTQVIKKDADKLADRSRILDALHTPDPDFSRGQLKAIVFSILLQEETHSIEETRLDEKVIEFEKDLVKRSKTIDFFDAKKHDPERWHHYDTYRIVLEAA